ncbi:hypothetical protein Efla_004321 [Eimeria flavescens]
MSYSSLALGFLEERVECLGAMNAARTEVGLEEFKAPRTAEGKLPVVDVSPSDSSAVQLSTRDINVPPSGTSAKDAQKTQVEELDMFCSPLSQQTNSEGGTYMYASKTLTQKETAKQLLTTVKPLSVAPLRCPRLSLRPTRSTAITGMFLSVGFSAPKASPTVSKVRLWDCERRNGRGQLGRSRCYCKFPYKPSPTNRRAGLRRAKRNKL